MTLITIWVSKMKIYVNYENSAWRKYKIDWEKIASAAARAAGAKRNAEISITLTDDKSIKKINKKYRNINKPTNVLSFELGDDVLLGDIFISLDTVVREAKTENISVHDHAAHMVVHGVLHLMGYDHIKNSDAELMEKMETIVLNRFDIKNPYATVRPIQRKVNVRKKVNKLSKKFTLNYFWLRGVLLVFCGAISALGFAPFNLWLVSLIGIGGAYWIATRDYVYNGFWRTMLRMYPFAAAYAIAMFGWTVNSIYVVPELTQQFAIWTIPAIVGIGLVGGFIFATPFATAVKSRAIPICRPIIFAALWTVVLWLREWLFTGFPWNPIANITLSIPMVSNTMSLYGALGLSFIIIGIIASAVEFIRAKFERKFVALILMFLIPMAVGIVWSGINIWFAKNTQDMSPYIRIVQPAKSQSDKMVQSREDAIMAAELNIRQLLKLGADMPGGPDVIVYPETTYPFVLTGDDMPFSGMAGVPIVIGATTTENGNLYNSMVITNARGVVQHVYSKSHLVPFGEYSPLGFMPAPVNLARGNGAETITMNLENGAFVFAPAICYEIIFSDSLVPHATSPQAIINITNDTWFGKTSGTYQHLSMVRRYAIESGLPVVRANYSGISAFILSDGTITASLPIGTEGILDGYVWGAHKTPYRFIGRDGWVIIILIYAAICAIWLNLYRKN